MSYDFDLFYVPAGVDPIVAYKRQLAEQERRAINRRNNINNSDPRNSSRQEKNRALAKALTDAHPALKQAGGNYEEVVASSSIGQVEARRQSTHLELNDLDLGLQIMLFDDTASVAIPFWRSEREKAKNTLRAAWECLLVLESQGGYSVYDNQVGKVLDLGSDFDTVLDGYAGMTNIVDKALRKARWKFW